ncbi:MAG: hypothetical protein MHM6MM_002867 [Cercozoa sp. M6MM]
MRQRLHCGFAPLDAFGVGHGDVVLFEGPQDTSKSRILQQLAVVCALPESLGGRNRPVVVVDVFAQWDTHVLRRVIGAIVRTCHANSQTGTDGTDSNSDHNIDQIINDIMQHISILQVFELQDILQAVKDVNLSQTGLFVFDGVDAHFWRRRRRKEDSIIAQELLKALASRYASNGNNYENSVGMVTALSATIRFKRNLKLLQRKGYCDSTVFERNVPMQRAVSLRVLLRRVDDGGVEAKIEDLRASHSRFKLDGKLPPPTATVSAIDSFLFDHVFS